MMMMIIIIIIITTTYRDFTKSRNYKKTAILSIAHSLRKVLM